MNAILLDIDSRRTQMEVQDFRSYMTIGAHMKWDMWDRYIETIATSIDRKELVRLLKARELFHRCMQEGDYWISLKEENEVKYLIDSAMMWTTTDKFKKV